MGARDALEANGFLEFGHAMLRLNLTYGVGAAGYSLIRTLLLYDAEKISKVVQARFEEEALRCLSELAEPGWTSGTPVHISRDALWAKLDTSFLVETATEESFPSPEASDDFDQDVEDYHYGLISGPESLLSSDTISIFLLVIQRRNIGYSKYTGSDWLRALPFHYRDLFDMAFEEAAARHGAVFEPFDYNRGLPDRLKRSLEPIDQCDDRRPGTFNSLDGILLKCHLLHRLPPVHLSIGLGEWIAPLSFRQALFAEEWATIVGDLAKIDGHGRVWRRVSW